MVTSTGFDSIIWFDLKEEKFQSAFLFRKETNRSSFFKKIRNRLIPKQRYISKFFNPNIPNQLERLDSTHINSVFTDNNSVYFSGTSLNHLYRIEKKGLAKQFYSIPWETHNGRFSNGSVYFNNTPTNIVNRVNPLTNDVLKYQIPDIVDVEDRINSDQIAKRSFNRGMLFHDDILIVGSSPSNITVFNIHSGKFIKQLQLSNDIKNAIHGIALYPFD